MKQKERWRRKKEEEKEMEEDEGRSRDGRRVSQVFLKTSLKSIISRSPCPSPPPPPPRPPPHSSFAGLSLVIRETDHLGRNERCSSRRGGGGGGGEYKGGGAGVGKEGRMIRKRMENGKGGGRWGRR